MKIGQSQRRTFCYLFLSEPGPTRLFAGLRVLIHQLGVGIALRLRRADEFEWAVKAERGGGRRGRKYEIAA